VRVVLTRRRNCKISTKYPLIIAEEGRGKGGRSCTDVPSHRRQEPKRGAKTQLGNHGARSERGLKPKSPRTIGRSRRRRTRSTKWRRPGPPGLAGTNRRRRRRPDRQRGARGELGGERARVRGRNGFSRTEPVG
jgi:hypothetical protein